MRESATILNCALATLALCVGADAMVADSRPDRYKIIPDRNLFGLKPAPPPIVDPPPTVALPKLTLNGITDILGRNLALMKALFPGKPGEPAKEQSYMLAEGQRDGDIEVLQVDQKAGSVKVNNSGTVMTLTFDKDAPKSTTPAPQLSPTGAVPPPATYPMPTTNAAGQRLLSLRNVRSPASTGIPLPLTTPTNADMPSPAVTPPMVTNAPSPAPTPDRPLTPEEQVVLKELEHEAAKQTLLDTTAAPSPVAPVPPVQSGAGLAPQ